MIKITDPNDPCIDAAADAFADFEYKSGESGIAKLYGGKENIRDYIKLYGQCMAKSGFLYATSENREGVIAYALPGQSMNFGTGVKLLHSMIKIMGVKKLSQMSKLTKNGGESLKDSMKKQKKKFIFVGLLAVAKPYQGQGYMRKTLEIALDQGRKLNVPVILETDAELKMKKYVSCGMKLFCEHKLCEGSTTYDMIWENN